jgi:hypothetical protein
MSTPTEPTGPTGADRRPRALFLVASDVAGRTSVLAGPYPTLAAAAARVPAVGERLQTRAELAGFGHLAIAEGARGAATYFGRA